jgi:hypothetical protein
MHPWGQKHRPDFPEEEEQQRKASKDESVASLRRGDKSVIPCKDDTVANLPRSTSGVGGVSPQMTKRNRQPL